MHTQVIYVHLEFMQLCSGARPLLLHLLLHFMLHLRPRQPCKYLSVNNSIRICGAPLASPPASLHASPQAQATLHTVWCKKQHQAMWRPSCFTSCLTSCFTSGPGNSANNSVLKTASGYVAPLLLHLLPHSMLHLRPRQPCK